MKQKSLLFWLCLFLVFSAGCSRKLNDVYNKSFLEQMGLFRARNSDYGILTSKSTMVADLPLYGDALRTPLRGLYLHSNRFLDGWRWTADDAELVSDTLQYGSPRACPHRIERIYTNGMHERIVLDPENPCGRIDIENATSSSLFFTPRFSFQSVDNPEKPAEGIRVTQSSDGEMVFVEAEGFPLLFGFLTNGEFAEEQREKVTRYAMAYETLPEEASVSEIGHFAWYSAKRATIWFAAGRDRETLRVRLRWAKKTAMEKRAGERVLRTLNDHPLYIYHSPWNEAMAWDLWRIESCIMPFQSHSSLAARLPLEWNDEVADASFLTLARRWNHPFVEEEKNLLDRFCGNLSARNRDQMVSVYRELFAYWNVYPSSWLKACPYESDIRTLVEVNRWGSWENPDQWCNALRYTDQEDSSQIRSALSGIRLTGIEVLQQFSRHNLIDKQTNIWKNSVQTRENMTLTMQGIRSTIVREHPELFSAPFFERYFRGNPYGIRYQNTSHWALTNLYTPDGLRRNALAKESNTCFQVPLWGALRGTEDTDYMSYQELNDVMLRNEAETWVDEGWSSAGSLTDCHVSIARLRFLYEHYFGILLKPRNKYVQNDYIQIDSAMERVWNRHNRFRATSWMNNARFDFDVNTVNGTYHIVADRKPEVPVRVEIVDYPTVSKRQLATIVVSEAGEYVVERRQHEEKGFGLFFNGRNITQGHRW